METSDPGRCKARVVVGRSGALRSLTLAVLYAHHASSWRPPTTIQHAPNALYGGSSRRPVSVAFSSFTIRLSESVAFKIRPKVALYKVNLVALALGILRM